jgi:hypothetical protein
MQGAKVVLNVRSKSIRGGEVKRGLKVHTAGRLLLRQVVVTVRIPAVRLHLCALVCAMDWCPIDSVVEWSVVARSRLPCFGQSLLLLESNPFHPAV